MTFKIERYLLLRRTKHKTRRAFIVSIGADSVKWIADDPLDPTGWDQSKVRVNRLLYTGHCSVVLLTVSSRASGYDAMYD